MGVELHSPGQGPCPGILCSAVLGDCDLLVKCNRIFCTTRNFGHSLANAFHNECVP
jgi:hypothetical protein